MEPEEAERRQLTVMFCDLVGSTALSERLDPERDDALAMLRHMAKLRQEHPGPRRVSYTFQHTDAWEQVRRQIDQRQIDQGRGRNGSGAARVDRTTALDELRLETGSYHHHRRLALARATALELSRLEAAAVSTEQAGAALERFRLERGLLEPAELAGWLEEQGLTAHDLARLMLDEARLTRLETMLAADLERSLPEHLQLEGRWAALVARAQDKQDRLAAAGLDNPSLADAGLSESGLWHWLFKELLGAPVPDDIGALALTLDLAGIDSLRRTALRERCYLQLLSEDLPDLR